MTMTPKTANGIPLIRTITEKFRIRLYSSDSDNNSVSTTESAYSTFSVLIKLSGDDKVFKSPSKEITKGELCRFSPDLIETQIKESVFIAGSGVLTPMCSSRIEFKNTRKIISPSKWQKVLMSQHQ